MIEHLDFMPTPSLRFTDGVKYFEFGLILAFETL